MVSLPWPDHAARKVRLVDGVRELLCLKTEPSMLSISGSFLATQTVIRWDEVAGVELNTWLVGEALQPSPGHRVLNPAVYAVLGYPFINS